MIFLAILLTLLGTNWAFVVNRPKCQAKSFGAVPAVEIFSLLVSAEQTDVNPYLLEVVKSLGQLSIPVALGFFFVNTVEKQIAANYKATNDLLAGNKDLIAVNNKATNDLIAGNKDLIAANKEIAAESIKSSEARIENILQQFKISFQSSANNKES